MPRSETVHVPLHTYLGITIGAFCLSWGYLTVWIPHDVAGLAVLGIDFLTFIKFLPPESLPQIVRLSWWWCLPLLTTIVTLNQTIWCLPQMPESLRHLKWPCQFIMTIFCFFLCLHALPLDWQPENLLWPSNLVQTAVFTVGVGLTGVGPLTSKTLIKRLHWWLPVLSLASLVTIPFAFFYFVPFFSSLYGQTLMPGPGFYLTLVGGLALVGLSIRFGLIVPR